MGKMTQRDQNIILFGSPGVGKGAQATLLSGREEIPHVSTGQVLREEIARGTDLGLKAKAAVEGGHYVDDAIILEIVENLLKRADLEPGFVMDGFPRTVVQAERFDEILERLGRKVHHAIFIDASEDIIRRRLTGRLVCSDCDGTYNTEFHPSETEGVCDLCGGTLERRQDDTPKAHNERMRVFRERTRPLLDYYREAGVLVKVDGEMSIENVAAKIQDVVRNGR